MQSTRIPARAAALVVREWCCVKAELLVWRHYTHFEAQRAGCRIVVVDLLCDGFGEVFCAAEFGVQVQVKEVGFCVGFVFLRCDSVKRLVRSVFVCCLRVGARPHCVRLDVIRCVLIPIC